MEKWLNLALGQETHKMSLGHLVEPESREAVKNKPRQKMTPGYVKGTHELNEKGHPKAKAETI